MTQVPDWSATLTPYLAVNDATNAIRFYEEAFGAVVTVGPLVFPGGVIGHAEMKIGNAAIMLADGGVAAERVAAPTDIDATTVQMHLYVDDADATVAAAIAAGAEIVRPLEDAFDGRRVGKVRDPFGHSWFIASVREPITQDELNTRLQALMD